MSMPLSRTDLLIALLVWGIALPSAAGAASLLVSVKGDDGENVADAVVEAVPIDGGGALAQAATAKIDQIDKEYVPYLTALQMGTKVNFPNLDNIRHHVYSFSKAKTFEIPLYRRTPPAPILFDKPGPVTLGCNIHDWMRAYVFVSETPYFGVTALDGSVTLRDLPAGDYDIRVWHPRLKGEAGSTAQRLSISGTDASLSFTIQQKRLWRARRAPTAGQGSYR
jgi:plastocyanin